MITERLRDDKLGINRAVLILQKGGVVAIPTETVYGLAADACNSEAIAKIFTAKGRPQDNPLIVHIANMGQLGEIACEIPQKAYECAEKFWPGPFTMILKRTGKTSESVSAGLETVAVRMPKNEIALEIIKKSGLPLAAPSANTSGKPSPTTADHVFDDLNGRVDAIVFGSDCEVGVESTVVSFVGKTPRILRPGAVTKEQLAEIIPEIEVDKAVLAEPEKNEKVASPGMKYKHYAPKTESYLVEGDSDAFVRFVNEKEDCAAVCFESDFPKIKIKKLSYGDIKNEETLAHTVFSVLREVDSLDVSAAYIHAPSKDGIGLAVYNRLIRACGFRVITL